MRPEEFHPDRIQVVTGRKQHKVALPLGDTQVDYWINADAPVKLYLYAGEKLIPIDVGHRLRGRLRVKDCNAMAIVCEESTLVAVEVYGVECWMRDQTFGPPAFVEEVAPVTMNLQAIMGRMQAMAAGLDPDEEIDVSADVEEAEGFDPEFGPGFQEMEGDDFDEEVADEPEALRRVETAQREAARKRSGDVPVSVQQQSAEPGTAEADAGSGKQSADSGDDPGSGEEKVKK